MILLRMVLALMFVGVGYWALLYGRVRGRLVLVKIWRGERGPWSATACVLWWWAGMMALTVSVILAGVVLKGTRLPWAAAGTLGKVLLVSSGLFAVFFVAVGVLAVAGVNRRKGAERRKKEKADDES